jgi:hypothetical protein
MSDALSGADFINNTGLDTSGGDTTSATGGGFGSSAADNGSGSGFFGSLISGLTNPNTIRGIIGAGTQLLGSGLTTSANTQAAQIASQAAIQAAQIQAQSNQQAIDKTLAAQQAARDEFRAASQRGIGDITQGVSDYTGTISPLLTPAPISLPTYRDLTTQQQTGESDLLRNANAQLAASGARGAGRAGVGAIIDQDRRYQEDARAANDAQMLQARQAAQNVSNTARTGLAQIQAQAGGSKANTEMLTGNQLGSSLQSGGNTASSLTAATGQSNANAVNNAAGYNANATTANAANRAGTLGSIAGAFSTPYTLGAGDPNAPGLYGAGGGTGYADSGSFEV